MTQTTMSFRPEFQSLAILCLVGAVVGCQGSHPQTTAPEPHAPAPDVEPTSEPVVVAEQAPTTADIRELAARNPAAALNELDQLGDLDAELTLLFGETVLQLFQAKEVDGSLGPGLAEDLLFEAEEAFQRAFELGADPIPTLRGLLNTRRLAGDAAGAWEAGQWLFTRVEPQLVSGEDVAADTLLAIGTSGLDFTVAAVQSGDAPPASAYKAAVALESAMSQGVTKAVLPLADLYAWQGEPKLALETLTAGLQASPNDAVLFGRVQNLGSRNRSDQVTALEQLCLDCPGEAMPLWYLGEARYWQGRDARVAADTLKALECWDRAEASFKQAMALNPDFAATCADWLFLVRTQRGWTLRDEGRIADAAASFLHTLEGDPERLEDASDPNSLRLGIDAICADFFRSGNLKEARGFLRQVCAIHDGNSDWTNNLGFFCRDLGAAALAAGNQELATQYFEESWDAYCRTVELTPDDARLVNDRALIAVYYLDDYWELAEQELHRSIALGTRTLAEMAEDVPEEERNYFDMAIGDAWENLAYLYLIRRGEVGDSATYIQNSLEHFPFDRRDGIPPLQRKLEELRKTNR
jgi:tetratricopeptide (TPR) repeat protein